MTLSYHFSPLPHADFWEPYDRLPHRPNPHFKHTKVGRNPTRRRRTEMDQRDVGHFSTQREASSSQPPDRIQRCKLCHQTGHNRRPFHHLKEIAVFIPHIQEFKTFDSELCALQANQQRAMD
ncbi:hypothetical protein QQ045_011363 [Rhodiola kirilowii]